MIHQPAKYFILVEVDKEVAQSVFYFLKEKRFSVFLEPNNDLIEKYLPSDKENLIVNSLVSEAPIQKIKNIFTPTLEKILVDIFCDDVLFTAQQGAEMRTIFQESFDKYAVNEDRMLRYADRRGKKDSFLNYIQTFSNLRQ
jgi:hypothetical protein